MLACTGIVGVMDEKLTTEHTESKYNPEWKKINTFKVVQVGIHVMSIVAWYSGISNYLVLNTKEVHNTSP